MWGGGNTGNLRGMNRCDASSVFAPDDFQSVVAALKSKSRAVDDDGDCRNRGGWSVRRTTLKLGGRFCAAGLMLGSKDSMVIPV